MTIAYKLLGIPRTFDEFVDKVKRSRNNKVDIAVRKYNSYPTPFNIVPWNRSVVVRLETGKIRTKLKTYTYNTHRGRKDLFDVVIGKAKIEQTGLQYALEVAEKLQKHELELTINGNSIENIKEVIIKYGQNIEEKVKEFSEIDN